MTKNKIISSLLVTSYLLSVFLSGCVTITMREPRESYSVNGAKYFSLADICQLNDIFWSWDAALEVATLVKDEHSVKLMPESRLVFLDGKEVITLDKPVLIRSSRLLVPYSFKNQLVGRFFYEEKRICAPQQVLISKRIVIDPGHGGKDPGAIARAGLEEKDLVLDIAKALKKRLSEKGMQVVLTRSSDNFISLEERSQIANKSKADLFMSIHANANHNKSLSGIEVYYLSNLADDAGLAQRASRTSDIYVDGDVIQARPATVKAIVYDMLYTDNRSQAARLARFIVQRLSSCTGLRALGVKQANFSVLRSSLTPSVLVEVGYLSNRGDANKLDSANFKEQVAEGLTAALVDFFTSQPPEYY